MTSLSPVPTAASPRSKSDDDVVVVAAYRSAIGKAKRGIFKVSPLPSSLSHFAPRLICAADH